MNVQEFFECAVVQLPRHRDDEDFERYVKTIFAAYIGAIETLNASCHLCSRIQAATPEIRRLCDWIEVALRHYFSGTPDAAYDQLVKGIDFVYARLGTLLSHAVGAEDINNLYRVADTKGKAVSKERLFHAPFHLRHKVGQNRYGIPGFPCLYLGGSLELCIEECRIQDAALPGVSVAQFGLRNKVKLLDFAYRPSALARVSAGSAMKPAGANAALEQFIINYATCWPLIAASSIRVLHDGDPFVYEYVIPQMILQWAMRNTDCDGIRYFSTRFIPDPEAIRATANFVFPDNQRRRASGRP